MKSLDKLEGLEELDASSMRSILLDFPEQYRQAYRLAEAFTLPQDFGSAKNIVISGMGGSAIGGDLLRSLYSGVCPVPIVINRNYSVPAFVNEDTLFIAASYSGNTEETLSAFDAAMDKRAKVMAISTGGKLEDRCKEAGAPFFSVPGPPMQPRCAFGHLFTPMMVSLSKLGLIPDSASDMEEAIKLLSGAAPGLSPDAPILDNEAKRIAQAAYDKLPVVYASQNYFDVVAMRWKGQFNENSKAMAFHNVIPEMNHNEIVGWGIPANITRQCVVIFLCHGGDFSSIVKRTDITRALLAEETRTITVQAQGSSPLAKALYLIYLGDFASYYLAFLNDVDPTPIARIDLFKAKLDT